MAKKEFSYEKINVRHSESLSPLRTSLVNGITIGELAIRVQNLLHFYPEDASISLSVDYYDESSSLDVCFTRLETDIEQRDRINRHEKAILKKQNAPAQAAAKAEAARLRKIETLRKEAAKLGLALSSGQS